MIIEIDTVKFTDQVFSEYGLAMLISLIVNVMLYRMYSAEKLKYTDLVDKVVKGNEATLVILTKVEQRLQDQQGLNRTQDTILTEISSLKSDHKLIIDSLKRIDAS